MIDKQRRARRAALRTLYAIDVSGYEARHALETIRATLAEPDDHPARYWDLVVARVHAVIDNLAGIDEEIRILSPRWRIERMAAVDRNLLRLGVSELLEGETAPLVVINACVELAKEFGDKGTPGFINGLLDQLCQNRNITIAAPDEEEG
ncbi:transcription antitermination factor NusB [Lujinxingia vulgaris]|uniref:Transcription antitermination protein NusB n=1 Tax=Lujinxingia vulgaris TaxID=2600176 RepID=A0A5C6XB04_9DELT|nr:transcription antitermination factor NusB [Lujinxingia vulgaris]TXD36876.1 transcription antitermination factor NusB [Lujinxingia vulgaris]